MSLQIKHIKLTNFRNYSTFNLSITERPVVIVGENAIGKTNIIEAFQLLTSFQSFRTIQWGDLVRWNSNEAHLSLDLHGDNREITVSLNIKDNRRIYLLNDKKKKVNQIRGLIPSVIFSPDDLKMIKEGSEGRRDALDAVGIQLSLTYSSLRERYNKAVRQRNALLKSELLDIDMLDSWNQSIQTIGSSFYIHRHNLFNQLITSMKDYYRLLSPQETLEVEYIPSWLRRRGPFSFEICQREQKNPLITSKEVREVMIEASNRLKVEEYRRRMTLIGPHRDEICFFIDGYDARYFGSQGQQRTLVLAWKLAEVFIIEKISKQPPLLLLDDVMSELDEARRNALMQFTGKGIQTIITTTSLDYFSEDIIQRSQIEYLL